MLREIAADVPGKILTVLEAGCGNGHFGELISREFLWKGFDFCRYVVDEAKDRGLDAWVGNVYGLLNYIGDYNIFVAMEVLEHVDDKKVLSNVRGGVWVLCSVPLNEPVVPGEATAHVRWYKGENHIRERFAEILRIDKFIKVKSTRGNTSIMFWGVKL